ncbi:Pyridoxal phosphate-dependent transferase, major domain [Penicillium camemberti]|uniref:Pyridoxal phosphate-dependent transferase, major domain n=1 Tax=Penicillium camemberti (strain FM 013) TaxID=1429867 RepID=A0A0G4PBN0_PENC3|nr:Pyridoxal phosphate-dependent transferase, major domain [Penicillium camemberti]
MFSRSYCHILAQSRNCRSINLSSAPLTLRPGHSARAMSATASRPDPFRPAKRVAGQRQDVWSIVNEAAAASPVQPIVNMGQGFFGYNPPKFALDAAKDALDRVECNQYSPTKGRPRLRQAIADAYSPFFGKKINPETEVSITTGANEGMLSAFMGFIEDGDEVIIFEPFFDQYISNIEMPGGTIRYVPLHPPKDGATKTSPASEWTINFEELEGAMNSKTKMIVRMRTTPSARSSRARSSSALVNCVSSTTLSSCLMRSTTASSTFPTLESLLCPQSCTSAL